MISVNEKNSKTINNCRFCWMCRHACTVGNITGRESTTPRGRALDISALLKGVRSIDDDFIETMYQCALCGVCTDNCISRIDVPSMVLEARENIVSKKKLPKSVLKVKNNVIKYGNPFGRISNKGLKIKKNADVMLFSGSFAAHKQKGIIVAAKKILKKAGVDFSEFPLSGCCQSVLYNLGFKEDAVNYMDETKDVINYLSPKVLVVLSSECYYFLKNVYPEELCRINPKTKIVHIFDYILSLIEDRKIKLRKSKKLIATWHPSCGLKCKGNTSGSTRKLINAIPGISVKNMINKSGKGVSCGVGGGLYFTYPEIVKDIRTKVIEEAQKTGAHILITESPDCHEILSKVKKNRVKVVNLVNLVLSRL